jgi:hypothetical protein
VKRGTIVLALLLSAASVAAQDRPRRDLASAAGADRDQVFKMVDAYIVSNLQESLGLSDDQFVKLLPLVKRLQTDRRAFAQKRQQSLQEMRRLLQSGAATEGRLAALLAEVKTVEQDEPAAVRKDREAIDAALSPVQQAKFRVLEVEVEQKLRELMTRIRQARQGERLRRGQRNEPPP